MAVAGYGVELTVESIWNTEWVTARFDFININIGTMFNFWITGVSETDITNASVAAICAAESNNMFSYWNALAKIEKTVNPWDFITIWWQNHFQGDGFYNYFEKMIKKCRMILGEDSMEIVSSRLPSSTSSW